MSVVKVLKTKHTGENKVRVPRTYPGKSPLFGYIKKIDGRWAVFGWENSHGEQAIGGIEYTNIDPQLVADSTDHFGLREGPFVLNWQDCRIDKSIASVIC